MGATPQPPRNTPDGLIRWMKWVEGRISFILEKLNNVLANTGLSVPSPGVTQVDQTFNVLGTQNVSGNLNVSGTETVSGSLNVTGNETVGGTLNVTGNTVIGGTLSLPNGIINNAALANPVVPQSVWQGTTADFSLSPAWSDLVTVTLTVPSGVTSVQVMGFVRLVASNTTASKDYLYSDMYIGGTNCGGFSSPVAAGDVGISYCSYARTIAGLTAGSTVVLKARGSTGTGTWTPSGNVCQMAASVTWYR